MNGESHGKDNLLSHYNVHGAVVNVECNYDGHNVSGIALDDRDVPSVCDISGLSICVRQFFPCEGIRQGQKMFDIMVTVAVMG